MINFNSSHLYTLPSYSMQSMFSQALGDYVVTSSLEDAGARAAGSRKAVASVKGDILIWKATNYVGLSAAHIVESVWLLRWVCILLLTTRGGQGDAAVEVVLEKQVVLMVTVKVVMVYLHLLQVLLSQEVVEVEQVVMEQHLQEITLEVLVVVELVK